MSFIRRKRVHAKVKDGRKSYFYYYRVASERRDGKVVQVLKDYLGTAEEAIERLEQVEMDQAERQKLLSKLEAWVSEELGNHA
ncbi:MAG TPA: hypothetical protein VIQ31_34805, partial [Phormidium sp.]